MQDTIEARIEDILRLKADLFDQLVDDASLVPQRLFSRQALFEMVGLQ